MEMKFRRFLCLLLAAALLAVCPAVLADEVIQITRAPDEATAAPEETGKSQSVEIIEATVKPAQDPTAVSAEEPVNDPGAVSAEEPVNDPGAVSAEEPTQDPGAVSAEDPAEQQQSQSQGGNQSNGNTTGAQESKPFLENLKEQLQKEIDLFGLKLKLWILIAAGAGLILIVLLLVLLLTKKKRGKARKGEQPVLSDAVLKTDNSLPVGDQMLSLDDEPTVNLSDPPSFSADMQTQDVGLGMESTARMYTVQLRLFYGDQYMDSIIHLGDGQQAVIGRANDADVQTNPADVSVSHRHGKLHAENGKVLYTDTSRNGSRLNGTKTIGNGEDVLLPFNTRCELELGSHRIWIIVRNS